MANTEKTPEQRAQVRMAEHQALSGLGYYASVEEAKLQAKLATASLRAELKYSERLTEARHVLAMPQEDVDTILRADAVFTRASAKAEAQGAIEAAAEAGLAPTAVTVGALAVPTSKRNGKGKGKGRGKPAPAVEATTVAAPSAPLAD